MQKLALVLLSTFTLNSMAAIVPISLNIQLANNNEAEKLARKILVDSTDKFDLSQVIFTKKVVIQTGVIPHSHPVLTLNTRTINDPNMYLATFIHEQFHWFFASNEKATDKFVELMKGKFPKVPVGNKNGGAKDEFSTYLHLGVCYYEYQYAAKLFGKDEAKRIFRENIRY